MKWPAYAAAAPFTISPPGNVERIRVELDDASSVVPVKSRDSVEAHLDELDRRELALRELAAELLGRKLRQLGMRAHDRAV